MDVEFEHEVVADVSAVHLASVARADLHEARGRWAGVGDRSCRCDHADVEAERDGLLAGAVHALDVVCPRSPSHQFRMLLDDQNERCFTLLMER